MQIVHYHHTTYRLTRAWLESFESSSDFALLMASSEVDQKYLGQFAKDTTNENPYLSAMLYKILGLSVLLSRKLVRARKLRKLDNTRDTKSLQLYHHIIWLSREGLVIVEQHIIPMIHSYLDLKVLSYKLRASFYHIYVLFHNQPSVHQTSIPSFAHPPTTTSKGKAPSRNPSLRTSPGPNLDGGGPVRNPGLLPPGLAPVSVPKPSASFLLPALDYIPLATQSFTEAASLADFLLSGSHPIRLSVKLEYAAFLFDCLHDGEASRRLAQQAIRDVYNAQEAMDDDAFEDAAELVGVLGKMMKRGAAAAQGAAAGGGAMGSRGSTPGGSRGTRESTPRAGDVGAGWMEGVVPVPDPVPGIAMAMGMSTEMENLI
ncbi:14-3-3 protein [Lasallia pustulata]|uniref:14-3-3 protein n=1 Tax=Lasallia pustulata TaxID=136370 RepID=A0A1W5D353_9LECA|nr:14-3-3 protein [Lasallia pustulata]